MKTLKLIVGFLAAALSISYSQDYPPSFGPAPFVNNIAPTSEVFYGANPLSRGIVCSSSSTSAGQKIKLPSLSVCTGSNLGPPITYFPGAYTRVNPNLYYIIDQIGLRLLRMDSLGNETLLGPITGTPLGNLLGLTWNAANGQMYIIGSSLAASQIGTIDTNTRIITTIGSPQATCAGAISASIAPQGGSLFAIDIVADNFYKFNLATGVATLVGPLGNDPNFGQDAQFDYDGILYWVAYTTGPQLRTIDTATGGGTLICTFTGTQATAIATIPTIPPQPPITNACRSNLNLPINDFQTTRDSVIVTTGPNNCANDVNVRIDNLLHTFDSDLTFYLQHFNRGVKIINRVGGSGDNFINTVLDDQAVTPIASGTAPFTGSFIPSNSLSAFNYWAQIDGVWRLLVTDTVLGDSGVLNAWCIVITYYICEGGIQTIEIPNHYILNQNYPNPFNPVTKIKYGLPENAIVKLVIYDIMGREVTTLVNERKTSGTYEVEFDGAALSSGIYFYKLEARPVGSSTGDFIQTKKMLLVK